MKKQPTKVKKIAQRRNISNTIDLLKIADRLQVQARKAENIAIWQTKSAALLKQGGQEPLSILKAAQAQRDAGFMDRDQTLYSIFMMAEWLADDIVPNDPKLKEISTRISAIEKHGELADDECWLINDPDIPQDWRALIKMWDHHNDEILAAILKQCGEYEIADLFLNNREEFDLRFEAGRRLVFKDGPDQSV